MVEYRWRELWQSWSHCASNNVPIKPYAPKVKWAEHSIRSLPFLISKVLSNEHKFPLLTLQNKSYTFMGLISVQHGSHRSGSGLYFRLGIGGNICRRKHWDSAERHLKVVSVGGRHMGVSPVHHLPTLLSWLSRETFVKGLRPAELADLGLTDMRSIWFANISQHYQELHYHKSCI